MGGSLLNLHLTSGAAQLSSLSLILLSIPDLKPWVRLELRKGARNQQKIKLSEEDNCLTHFVITKSDYCDHYVDRRKEGNELVLQCQEKAEYLYNHFSACIYTGCVKDERMTFNFSLALCHKLSCNVTSCNINLEGVFLFSASPK